MATPLGESPAIAAPRPAAERLEAALAQLAAQAVAIDRDGRYPGPLLHELGAAGAFAGLARVKADLAGPIEATARVARLCGATAFCCWCQGALAWYLRLSANQRLRETWLPELAHGRALGGTALSNPMKFVAGLEDLLLRGARAPSGGWAISGSIPWVSNIEDGHSFAAIFATADGPPRMALINTAMPGLAIRPNDNYEVMAGTATVAARFREVPVGGEHIIAADAGSFIAKIRPGFVLLQAGIGLGLLDAAGDVMRASRRKPSAGLPQSLLLTPAQVARRREELGARVAAQAEAIASGEPPATKETMRLRLALAEAVAHAATAAQLMAGAPGLIRGRRAARLLREAAFFGVLTPSVRHLNHLLA